MLFLIQVHNDRSRDYTVQDSSIPTMPQAPILPTSTGWQAYPQSSSTYIGNDYAVSGQVTVPPGQMPSRNIGTSGGSLVSTSANPVSYYPTSSTSAAPTWALQASQSSPQFDQLANAQPPAAPQTQSPYFAQQAAYSHIL